MSSKDCLGDRIKSSYEHRTRYMLPRRTYTMCRIDGKSFHSYTKKLKRPFDVLFMGSMDETAKYLCENIQGAILAYVQSDEISVLSTDFNSIYSDAWFDGNIQKISSVSASLATAKFNESRRILAEDVRLACFDSRVFTIPDPTEVINYMIWRQNDAVRNSIQAVAQSQFSPKEMHGKSCNVLQDMLFTQKGINWNDFAPREKRGGFIVKESYTIESNIGPVLRTRWNMVECPIFTQDRDSLYKIIPTYDSVKD